MQPASLTPSKEPTKAPTKVTTFDYIRASRKVRGLTRPEGYLLSYYCDCADALGHFYQSYTGIAEDNRGLARSTISRYNRKFRDMKILTWVKGHGNTANCGAGTNTANSYQLDLKRMLKIAKKKRKVKREQSSARVNSVQREQSSNSREQSSNSREQSSARSYTKNPSPKNPSSKNPSSTKGETEIFSGLKVSGDVEKCSEAGEASPLPLNPESSDKRPPSALAAARATGGATAQCADERGPFYAPPPDAGKLTPMVKAAIVVANYPIPAPPPDWSFDEIVKAAKLRQQEGRL